MYTSGTFPLMGHRICPAVDLPGWGLVLKGVPSTPWQASKQTNKKLHCTEMKENLGLSSLCLPHPQAAEDRSHMPLTAASHAPHAIAPMCQGHHPDSAFD